MATPTPILTVTLNPALDLSTAADRVVPGPKLRCDPPQADPGGGGVNVSRAIRLLGGDSTALVALGGATGARMEMLLNAEGIRAERLDGPGETRQSLAVTDRTSGRQFRFVLPGPVWDDADGRRALGAIAAAARPDGLVVLSGSQPPGLPDTFPAAVQGALPDGARLVVDTSGAPMRRLAADPAGIFLLRLNGEEAEEMAGHRLAGHAGSAAYAMALVRRGVAQAVVLARGAEGNVLACGQGCWRGTAPLQKIVSPVGAGDSFVAGLCLALARGESLPGALRLGTAAAAAAVTTEATDLCRPQDVARILPQTVLEALPQDVA